MKVARQYPHMPVPAHILVVDDEPDHLSLMSDLLELRYRVTTARTAKQALEICRQRTFHLGLVDIRLPDMPGTELAERLRAINPRMGFVLVTAYADVRDAVRAVRDLGVVDYVAKPFSGREFVRCIDDALARLNTSSRVMLADLAICLESKCVWKAGQLLPLSRQEFDLLAYLACRPGVVVSHERLLNELWPCESADLSTDMLWSVMKRLRAKLGEDHNNPRYIRTVRDCGYQAIDSAFG